MQGKEKSAGKKPEKSFFQGVKAEFNKIVWTDRDKLIKQTAVVTVVTVVFVSVVVCTFTFFVIVGALLRLIAKWRTPTNSQKKDRSLPSERD